MDYKKYFTGPLKRKNSKLEVYGEHQTYEDAKKSAINRAINYEQNSVIYGVTQQNEVKVLQKVKVEL